MCARACVRECDIRGIEYYVSIRITSRCYVHIIVDHVKARWCAHHCRWERALEKWPLLRWCCVSGWPTEVRKCEWRLTRKGELPLASSITFSSTMARPPLRGQLHLHRQLLARLPVPGQVHLHRNTPRNTCITRCTATHHATPALLGVSAPQHTTQHVHYQVQLHRTTPRNTYFTSCTCTVLHHATHALPGASAPYLTPQYVLNQVHLHHIIPRNTCITRYICTYHTSKRGEQVHHTRHITRCSCIIPHQAMCLTGCTCTSVSSASSEFQIIVRHNIYLTRSPEYTYRTGPGAPAPYVLHHTTRDWRVHLHRHTKRVQPGAPAPYVRYTIQHVSDQVHLLCTYHSTHVSDQVR